MPQVFPAETIERETTLQTMKQIPRWQANPDEMLGKIAEGKLVFFKSKLCWHRLFVKMAGLQKSLQIEC